MVQETKDRDTGKIKRWTPSVVLTENPPSPESAKSHWRQAKERLTTLRREIDDELKALEKVRQLCLQLADARRDVAKEEAALAVLVAQRPPLEASRSQRQGDVEAAQQEHASARRPCAATPTNSPRLLCAPVPVCRRRERWKVWSRTNAALVEAEAEAARQLRTCEQALAKATAALDALAANIREAEESLSVPRQRVAQLSQSVDAKRRMVGDRLVDEQLFARGHKAWNLAAPWIPDSLHRKREDLFIAALATHRAFIDASAQKVLHNLSVLMDVFSSGPIQDETQRKLLGDLWSTLFLVVPVISTTFASVDRMLGDLPAGSIGWLLIDEAGQAPPQAAVGAIMRAKRSIVVGDPLQIPPIVTPPERLNSEICKFFKVDKSVWTAPDASVQTLADQASRFQATFQSDRGPRCVGIPLLVHRRCQEPMFGISNRIAYDGQMVHGGGAGAA